MPNVPTSDSGTDRLGMMVPGSVRKKYENHDYDQDHGEPQLEFHVRDRGADGHGAIAHRV